MAGVLDRDLYRKIKRMDKAQLEKVLEYYFNLGRQSLKKVVLDTEALKNDIGQIKGIGESRLNEIMEVIDRYLRVDDEKET